MFADLPGVTPVQSKLARCMALQTVNFLLGDNPAGISFQIGVGECVLSFLQLWWYRHVAGVA